LRVKKTELLFWQAQIEGLSERANTIAVDLPGHGNSSGDGFRTVPDYARSVMEFIDTLSLPAPIPCGLSLGGAIALDLLVHHGARLKAGVLANTGGRLKVLPAMVDTIENDYDQHLDGLVSFAVARGNQDDEDICRNVLACSTAGPVVTANDFRACDAFDLSDRLSSVSVPVLVLSAADDILTPVKYAEAMADRIHGARHVTLDGAGHMAPIEQPAAFNRAIERFLESLVR
jgi:pimeloyl-ACP methyl ester carboxylesterase